MNIVELKELYNAAPFQPFEIVLTNGASVRVAHPEFMLFPPDRRTVHVYDLKSQGVKRIDVQLIGSLSELPQEGKRKQKQ